MADAFILYSIVTILTGIISGIKNVRSDIKNRYIMEELTNILDEIEKELNKQNEKREILKKNIETKKIENTKIDSSKKFDKIDVDIETYYNSRYDERSFMTKLFDYTEEFSLDEEDSLEQKALIKKRH